MGNAKNVIIVILIIVVVILGYMLMVTFPKNAEAQCTDVVKAQVTSAVQQCMSGAQQCQQTLQQLIQIPACASALSQ